jgi:hypothetical protein
MQGLKAHLSCWTTREGTEVSRQEIDREDEAPKRCCLRNGPGDKIGRFGAR